MGPGAAERAMPSADLSFDNHLALVAGGDG